MKVRVINNSNFDLPEYKTIGSVGLDLKANIGEDVIVNNPPLRA